MGVLMLLVVEAATEQQPAFGSVHKAEEAMISLLSGMAIGTVGVDPLYGQARFSFGIPEVESGIHFVVVMIGLFAIGEVVDLVAQLLRCWREAERASYIASISFIFSADILCPRASAGAILAAAPSARLSSARGER